MREKAGVGNHYLAIKAGRVINESPQLKLMTSCSHPVHPASTQMPCNTLRTLGRKHLRWAHAESPSLPLATKIDCSVCSRHQGKGRVKPPQFLPYMRMSFFLLFQASFRKSQEPKRQMQVVLSSQYLDLSVQRSPERRYVQQNGETTSSHQEAFVHMPDQQNSTIWFFFFLGGGRGCHNYRLNETSQFTHRNERDSLPICLNYSIST